MKKSISQFGGLFLSCPFLSFLFLTWIPFFSPGRSFFRFNCSINNNPGRENPDIMKGTARPNSRACVALVTQAALKEMVYPGCLCVAMPTAVGLIFRFVGEATGRPLLGAQVLAGCEF